MTDLPRLTAEEIVLVRALLKDTAEGDLRYALDEHEPDELVRGAVRRWSTIIATKLVERLDEYEFQAAVTLTLPPPTSEN